MSTTDPQHEHIDAIRAIVEADSGRVEVVGEKAGEGHGKCSEHSNVGEKTGAYNAAALLGPGELGLLV